VIPTGPQTAPAAIRRLNLGRSQLAGGRIAGAKTSFEGAAAAEPTFAEPLVELAALAMEEGDQALADDTLGKAAAIDAASPHVAREKVRFEFLRGSLDAAAACDTLAPLTGKDPIAAAYCNAMKAEADKAQAAAAMTKARREGGPKPTP
jgi:tetratricopeptide (TPR) repeat protein